MSETGQATRESAAVAAWTVLLVMLGFLGFVAVSLVALQAYLAAIGPTVAHPSPRSFPEPRIGSDTPAVRQHLMNEQRARLSGYGWVDRERGLIRIPIERAMELLAARGGDGYAPLEAPPVASAPASPPVNGGTR